MLHSEELATPQFLRAVGRGDRVAAPDDAASE
jgi:hypothetical protein